ncbi:MAG: L-aspartate oxidase [Spirochaetota bacterium]|nr:MAG: L-aspartate oxidase [Spirochaetota bacterium]
MVLRDKTDVLIIGSGIAGCTAAITAASSNKHIVLLTKTADPMESNTRYAQGGIVTIGEDDSEECLYEDIMKAGDRISNPEAVKIISKEARPAVEDFLIGKIGVEFSKKDNGAYLLTKEAAHSKQRILHYYDMTGLEIQKKLLEKIKSIDNITLLSNQTAIDLITTHHNSKNPLLKYKRNQCLGAYVLDNSTKEVHTLLADSTIVATGGIGRLYQYTTNPECATGDGISMAYRAGAQVINMEYVQFHPTMLYTEEGSSFLISEAVRGEGGKLINRCGEAFMEHYSPEWKDLAPRDEVTRAIYNEMAKTESSHVYLDIANNNTRHINISKRFPTIYEECKRHKIDIEKEPIPVVPGEHYFCGGILIDDNGLTTLDGLYAVGEASCSGVHGANRLASVSLLEGLVFGKRAGSHAVRSEISKIYFKEIDDWIYPKNLKKTDNDPFLTLQDWNNLKTTMWSYVGIIRTETRLIRAVSDLRNLYSRITDYYRDTDLTRAKVELRNGIIVAHIIAQFARMNKTTTGCHYIKD